MSNKIYILSADGLLKFGSVSEAESTLEAIDVESGEYEIAFDEHGRIYDIKSTDLTTFSSGIVKIVPTDIVDECKIKKVIASCIHYNCASNVSLREMISER